MRPDAVHTSLLDGLVWMDPKLVRFELHPGLTEPGGHWSQSRPTSPSPTGWRWWPPSTAASGCATPAVGSTSTG